MEGEKVLLPRGEPTDVRWALHTDTHTGERKRISYWRDQDSAIVIKSDKTTVE